MAHTSIAAADKTLQQSTTVFRQITNALFAGNSIWVLLASLVVAGLVGKLFSVVLRKVSRIFSRRADAATSLETVNSYRRLETWTVLSIAIIRTLLFVLGLYFWWTFTHPHNQPSALVGASALLAIILGGVFSPLLRDFAFGGSMMAEHWFGVGDLISIPYPDVQGVVERITLRSTRIRGLNGEIIWVANQNISAVRVAQKGAIVQAIELFVKDPDQARLLLEETNALLPTGPALLVRPLEVMTEQERGKDLWHLTAIGETAPGREWLLERTAIDLLKDLDSKAKSSVLVTDPVAHYADNETERQFARAVKNARKTKRPRRRPQLAATRQKKQKPKS